MSGSPRAPALAHPAFGTAAGVRDLLRFGLLCAPGGTHHGLFEAPIPTVTAGQTGGLRMSVAGIEPTMRVTPCRPRRMVVPRT